MDNVMKLAMIISLSDRITSPMGNVVRMLQKVQNNANKTGQAMQQMGHRMKQAGANMMQSAKGQVMALAGIGMAIAVPIRAAMEFESVMADVNKVADFSQAEYAAMSKELLDMSKHLPMSASGLGEIMAAAAQSGIAKEELAKFTEAAAKMGVAFGISAGEAGSAMTGMRNIFHLSQSEVVTLGDAVNHLSNKMDATASNILNFLNRAGSVGDTFKMTGQQVSAFGATMIALKTPPEVASRAFGAMLMQLSKGKDATKSEQAAFAELGMSAEGMAAMMKKNAAGALVTFLDAVKKSKDPMGVLRKLIGQGCADDIVKLVGNTDMLKTALTEVWDQKGAGYSGSMLSEYETRSKTTANQLQLLKNNIEAVGVTVGTVFLPPLNDAMKKIIEVVDAFGAWAEKNPETISMIGKMAAGFFGLKAAGMAGKFVFGGLLSSISPFVTGGGKLLDFLGNARAGFQLFKEAGSGNFASVIKGAWSATSLSVKLDKPISGIKNFFVAAGNIASVQGGRLASAIGRAGKSALDFGKHLGGKAVEGIIVLRDGLVKGALAAKNFAVSFAVSAWSGLKSFASLIVTRVIPAVWGFTASLLANPMTWVVVGVVALGAAIYLLWKNWDKVTAVVGVWWGASKQALSSLAEWFAALPGEIMSALSGLWEILTSPFKSAIDAVKGWWSGLKSWLGLPVEASVNVQTNSTRQPGGAAMSAVPQGVTPAAHAMGGHIRKPLLSWVGEDGAICECRKKYYEQIIARSPSQAVFRTGWFNRVNALAKEAGV